MKNQELAGFQAPFEIAAVKKFARQQPARLVLDQQVIDGVAAEAHVADGLTAHHPGANGVRAIRLDVSHFRKVDSVFVPEGQVAEQILQRVDAAFREQLRALRPNTFDHAHFRAEAHAHGLLFISLRREWMRQPRSLRHRPAFQLLTM